ncbi:MAG TPA: MATE family efflux transporter [Gallionellaceae bacterium]|nr:MATE family efflux transporter [Gallionellaceae bacterium]
MQKLFSPLSRELIRFAVPMLIAQLALMANAVIDTVMAGRITAVDLAAVGIGASVQVTVVVSLIAVLLALPPMVAHLHGAERHGEVGRELHQAVWISLVISAVAMAVLLHPDFIIAHLHVTPAVATKLRAYLAASAISVPATVAFRLFVGLSTGLGRPRPVMTFNLIALGMKVPLNAVFMFGLLGAPKMGGPGAAVATAIDQWTIALLAWGWVLNHSGYQEFNLGRPFARPSWPPIRDFLKLGIPIGLSFVADVTAFTLMALFIARLGPVVAGAHQIAANLSATAFMLPLSLGTATVALAGRALGAGDPLHARRISWRGVRLALTAAVVISATYLLGAPWIAAAYTADHAVQAVAIPLIRLAGIYHLADALQAVTVNALRGYKKSTVPMLVYGVLLWGPGLGGGVLLGLTHTLGRPLGAAGFWIAETIALFAVAISMALYLKRVSWMKVAQAEAAAGG